RGAVAKIRYDAFGAFAISVHHDDLARAATHDGRQQAGGADGAGADHPDLHRSTARIISFTHLDAPVSAVLVGRAANWIYKHQSASQDAPETLRDVPALQWLSRH